MELKEFEQEFIKTFNLDIKEITENQYRNLLVIAYDELSEDDKRIILKRILDKKDEYISGALPWFISKAIHD